LPRIVLGDWLGSRRLAGIEQVTPPRSITRFDMLEDNQHILRTRATVFDQRLRHPPRHSSLLLVCSPWRPVDDYGWHEFISISSNLPSLAQSRIKIYLNFINYNL
jgi:hypothetical protein